MRELRIGLVPAFRGEAGESNLKLVDAVVAVASREGVPAWLEQNVAALDVTLDDAD